MARKLDLAVPGDRILWLHFTPGQYDPVLRSGVVWDRGPAVDGAVVVYWVIPDDHADSDLYYVVPVGKSTRKHLPVHGDFYEAAYERSRVSTGTLYSSDYPRSPLGMLADRAAYTADRTRRGLCV